MDDHDVTNGHGRLDDGVGMPVMGGDPETSPAGAPEPQAAGDIAANEPAGPVSDAEDADDADDADDATEVTGGSLTEAQLEALLFVAERPLTRREIARTAGVPGDVVDQRLGDLEVSLGERGIRLLLSGERVELATAPEAGALIARYVGADAVRLSPASLET